MEQRNHTEKHGEDQRNHAQEHGENQDHNAQLEAARDYFTKFVPASQYLSKFIPVGYRFNPTDEELILHYLLPMINGSDLPINAIHMVNIYKFKPDYLTANYAAQSDHVWYFFTSRDRKYQNGSRPDRKAGDGYWKATGADKAINHEGKIIGSRKALVFLEGKPPNGRKTPWLMHEFKVADSSTQPNNKRKREHDGEEDTSMRLDDFVISRIYKKEATRLQKHVRVDNIEQEDEKVVEENGQNVAEAAFEQQDQQVEIGETSSHNNINAQINAPQMDGIAMNQSSVAQIDAPLMDGIAMNQSSVAQIDAPQMDGIAMNQGCVAQIDAPLMDQMPNNSHTSFAVDQGLDFSNFFTPMDSSSIFQGGYHNSFLSEFENECGMDFFKM